MEPLALAEWYNVIAVFRGSAGSALDSANIQVFVNGRPAAATIVGRSDARPIRWQRGTLHARDACFIGFESHQGRRGHQSLPFFGAIDEVLVFARALKTTEVHALTMTLER
jgi:hypothetical protein